MGMPDPTRALEATSEVRSQIADMFQYHPWDAEKTKKGDAVRQILAEAVAVIIDNVPPCPDRSSAIRMIRQARMEANSAITHSGKY